MTSLASVAGAAQPLGTATNDYKNRSLTIHFFTLTVTEFAGIQPAASRAAKYPRRLRHLSTYAPTTSNHLRALHVFMANHPLSAKAQTGSNRKQTGSVSEAKRKHFGSISEAFRKQNGSASEARNPLFLEENRQFSFR
jgi:hypothetical protein